MDIDRISASLAQVSAGRIHLYERRPGALQLIIPILHEDGDMVDIYLRDSPMGERLVRVTDFGLTLMRLSYSFEVNSLTRQRIFDSILFNNGVKNQDGNLFLDTSVSRLYESILQFAGCVQKICNMRYWSREVIRSTFYDDLEEYVELELTEFTPQPDLSPLPDYPFLTVDWSLEYNRRNFYLFGVRGDDKAKNVAISLLEFQKVGILFTSLIVHENMQELGNRASLYLTKNADIQYPALDDFRDVGKRDIHRLAGVSYSEWA